MYTKYIEMFYEVRYDSLRAEQLIKITNKENLGDLSKTYKVILSRKKCTEIRTNSCLINCRFYKEKSMKCADTVKIEFLD